MTAGVVYLFSSLDDRGNWSELGNLTTSDQASYDFFGISVSIYGDWIAVGADMSSGGEVARSGNFNYLPVLL